MAASREEVVRGYYTRIDRGEWQTLAENLASDLTHVRPDRTIKGAATFLEFMEHERPRTDTRHRIETVFLAPSDEDTPRLAVEGQLKTADGQHLFGFVDVFLLTPESRIQTIWTYTR